MKPKLNQDDTDHGWLEYGIIVILAIVVLTIVIATVGNPLQGIFVNLYRYLNGH